MNKGWLLWHKALLNGPDHTPCTISSLPVTSYAPFAYQCSFDKDKRIEDKLKKESNTLDILANLSYNCRKW